MIANRFFVFHFHKKICVVAALLLLCACASVRAQDTDEEKPLRIEANLVRLNVGVADRKGAAVTDLSRNDFVVYEDGVRQPIVSFEPAQSPFSLVLLLDVSGSTLSFRTTLKQAALRFIDALAPDDRVAVVAFNENSRMLEKFTSDRRKIAFAIERAEGHGSTNFYQALSFGINQLSHEQNRRKAIVVMTDGIDTEMRNQDRAAALNAVTDEQAIASIKPEASRSLQAVLDAADRQGVTIYPLALPSGDPKRLPEQTPQIMAIYSSARSRLETLANRTGGRLHDIHRLEDLGRLYAEVAADLRTLYTIAYQPSGARPRNGEWHSISIEVTRPELIARTRPGYYAR